MKTVCIDPGHGGADPGAVGYVMEKDVVLQIAQATKEILSFAGLDARMTRNGDITVPLGDRAHMANQAKADVLLSIHANAGGGTGFESYCQPGASEASHRLQGAIHKRISVLGVQDRGPKQKNLQVLRDARMPAVLVECLFVDHQQDTSLLQDARFLLLMGEMLAQGILDFLGVDVVDEGKSKGHKVSPEFAEGVEMARLKGLSTPGAGHDYTQPLTEERFWAFVARLLRWQ